MIYDNKGQNPLTADELRYLIKNSPLEVAVVLVMKYIMKYKVKWFHKKMIAHQCSARYTLTMAPRGIGKSEALDVAYCIALILRDPNITIAVITASLGQSKAFVRHIKEYFEEGSVITEIYGNLKGTTWTNQEFTVKRTAVKKEATVTSGCMTSSKVLISKHFEVIILDDIVSQENSRTKTQRDAVKEFMSNTVFPLLEKQAPHHAIKAIGTYYHFADYWTTLEASERFKGHVLKIPAIWKGKSIWEWKLPLKQLEIDRIDNGSIAFNMQYMLENVQGEGGIFKRSNINYLEHYTIEGGKVYALLEKESGDAMTFEKRELKIFIGCDLAISEKQSADRTCLSVIGVDEFGNIFLLELFAGRITFQKQMEEIVRLYNKYPNVIRIGIEQVGYQKSIAQELTRLYSTMPLAEIKTTTDKTTRFNIFAGMFEADKVYIYKGLKEMQLLLSEMLDFGKEEHDDTIDSFCIAFETYKQNHANNTARPAYSREEVKALLNNVRKR